MENYSNFEVHNVLLIYGKAGQNSHAMSRLYGQRFLQATAVILNTYYDDFKIYSVLYEEFYKNHLQ